MGALAKQVAALAAGGEATALCLSESDSFAPMQRDLMNLQQGVRRVVEAQLQSERISMQSLSLIHILLEPARPLGRILYQPHWAITSFV